MANQTSEKYTEDLFQAIDTIIATRVSKLPYDQTIICTIEDTTNAEYGKYLVRASNSTTDLDAKFTVFSEKTDYKVGDKVYVRIPMGDFTQQKVITGGYVAEDNLYNTDKDVFWTAEKVNLGDASISGGNYSYLNLYTKPQNAPFPAYYAFRLQFTPSTTESFSGTNYKQSDVDVEFELVVEYTIPTTLTTTSSKQTYTIKLRDYNANLLRNFSSKITVDIDLYSLHDTQIQVQKINLQNLRFVGNAVGGRYKNISLQSISYSFGYFIQNNINKLLVPYAESNFYFPDQQSTAKTVYFHYYDATDYTTKTLQPIQDLASQFTISVNDQIISDIIPIEEDFDGQYYCFNLPIGNNQVLRSSYQAVQVVMQSPDEIQNSIALVNANYYSQIGADVNDAKNGTRFLTAYTPTAAEEETARFNNGVFYIYGQDGKTTDSSASYVTRRAFVQFIDYFTGEPFDVSELSVSLGTTDQSMITLTSTVPELLRDNIAYITFKISDYYAQNKRNNSLIWIYNHDGIAFKYTQELLFGYSGSQGADYSLVLSLIDEATDKMVPAVIAGLTTAKTYQIRATLYDYSNNEKSIDSSDIVYSKIIDRGTPNWSLNNDIITVPANFIPNTTAGTSLYFGTVKAAIESLNIEAFLPIAVSWDADYILSGPSTITYDITGKKPFASKMPYKLYANASADTVMNITAEVVLPKANASDALKSLYPKISTGQTSLELPSAYSTDMNTAPAVVVIKQNGNTCWVQPLYIWQNKYPNSMVNGEANQVEIPEEGLPAGEVRTIVNTNVGRVLSNGTGMFIGDYGTSSHSEYGLFAFTDGENDKVKNIFRLTANGFRATGDITLMDGDELAGIGNENLPVYYKDGKPEPVMENIKNGPGDNAPQATLEDIVQAILDLKEAISAISGLSAAATTALNKIKLVIKET